MLKGHKKYNFPQGIIKVWNGLSEQVVSARSTHAVKDKLDKYRYVDGTAPA